MNSLDVLAEKVISQRERCALKKLHLRAARKILTKSGASINEAEGYEEDNKKCFFWGLLINPNLWRCIMFEVIVDKDKCTGCEECVNVCPAQVFEIEDGKSEPVEAEECLGCETCVEVCPEAAITVTSM